VPEDGQNMTEKIWLTLLI